MFPINSEDHEALTSAVLSIQTGGKMLYVATELETLTAETLVLSVTDAPEKQGIEAEIEVLLTDGYRIVDSLRSIGARMKRVGAEQVAQLARKNQVSLNPDISRMLDELSKGFGNIDIGPDSKEGNDNPDTGFSGIGY